MYVDLTFEDLRVRAERPEDGRWVVRLVDTQRNASARVELLDTEFAAMLALAVAGEELPPVLTDDLYNVAERGEKLVWQANPENYDVLRMIP